MTINASGSFIDQDGDVLTLSAISADESIATVIVNGTDLVVTPVGTGTVKITVTASDGAGGSVQNSFIITVSAPIVVTMTMADNDQPTQLLTTLQAGNIWRNFRLTLSNDTFKPGYSNSYVKFGGDLTGLSINGHVAPGIIGLGMNQVILVGVNGNIIHNTGQGTITIKGEALQSGKDVTLVVNIISIP